MKTSFHTSISKGAAGFTVKVTERTQDGHFIESRLQRNIRSLDDARAAAARMKRNMPLGE